MALRFVLDENLRGPLWLAVERHNMTGGLPIVERVGDRVDLPLGASDASILTWCEREGRILVSLDRATLSVHLAHHLALGSHSPGIFLVRPGISVREVVEWLELVAHAGEPEHYRDVMT